MKLGAGDERSRHVCAAINKTWATVGFESQPRFNERRNNKHIWWDITLGLSRSGRGGVMATDDSKNAVSARVLLTLALGNRECDCFSEVRGCLIWQASSDCLRSSPPRRQRALQEVKGAATHAHRVWFCRRYLHAFLHDTDKIRFFFF